MDELMEQVAQTMEKHGFEVMLADSAAQAKSMVLNMIPQEAQVGVGGSMTIRELDVISALEERGTRVWWHWQDTDDRAAVYEHARNADVYLASANAVTRDGRLVEIDGMCNRVASIVQGPKHVILVVGQQKLVDGGLNAAIARIHQQACPPNAKRLGLDTPCAHTGVCNQAECGDDCMCRVVMAVQRPPRGRKITVIFTEEVLGY